MNPVAKVLLSRWRQPVRRRARCRNGRTDALHRQRCAVCARSRFDPMVLNGSHSPPAPPAPPPAAARQNDRLAWRQLAPFLLILGVFMLLGYKYLTSASAHSPSVPPVACADGLDRYVVRKGDTCWEIASAHRWTVDELVAANKEVACDRLQIGQELCVPGQ
jgi:Tfp pilus assembly protein FimV